MTVLQLYFSWIKNSFHCLFLRYSLSFNSDKQSQSFKAVNTSEQAILQATKSCSSFSCMKKRIWSVLSNKDVVKIQLVHTRLNLCRCNSVSTSKISWKKMYSVSNVSISSKLEISFRKKFMYILNLIFVRKIFSDDLESATRKSCSDSDQQKCVQESKSLIKQY